MKNDFKANNLVDENGNPTGGNVVGCGFFIEWQNGPVGLVPNPQPPNGAFLEDVIQACIQRLQFFQASKFECDENANAVWHLREKRRWLSKIEPGSAKRVASKALTKSKNKGEETWHEPQRSQALKTNETRN